MARFCRPLINLGLCEMKKIPMIAFCRVLLENHLLYCDVTKKPDECCEHPSGKIEGSLEGLPIEAS